MTFSRLLGLVEWCGGVKLRMIGSVEDDMVSKNENAAESVLYYAVASTENPSGPAKNTAVFGTNSIALRGED